MEVKYTEANHSKIKKKNKIKKFSKKKKKTVGI